MKPNCVKIDASRDSMKNEIIDGKKTIFNCPEKSEKQFTIFITFVDEKKKVEPRATRYENRFCMLRGLFHPIRCCELHHKISIDYLAILCNFVIGK